MRSDATAAVSVWRTRVVAALADARIESPAGSTCRRGSHHAGIDLIPQVDISDRDGVFIARADFVTAQAPVIVEVEGLEEYLDPTLARNRDWGRDSQM